MRMLMAVSVAILFVAGAALADEGSGAPERQAPEARSQLERPFQVRVGEEAIDVPIGHAAPFVTDWNGDGKPDLLVGQFGEGKLRIYENVGAKGRPKFEKHVLFQAGGEDASIPSG